MARARPRRGFAYSHRQDTDLDLLGSPSHRGREEFAYLHVQPRRQHPHSGQPNVALARLDEANDARVKRRPIGQLILCQIALTP